MAPLYKRYIPPKASNDTVPAPVELFPTDTAPVPSEASTDHKRKRERTQDEVAERKAKKLKKKGIDPATVQTQAIATSGSAIFVAEPEPTRHIDRDEELTEKPVGESQGEFAHIKSKKKRHKLEKEARAARKAAEKAQKASQTAIESTNGDSDEPAEDGDVQIGAACGQGTLREAKYRTSLVAAEDEEKKKKQERKQRQNQQDADGQEGPTEVLEESDPIPKTQAEQAETEVSGSVPQPKRRRHKLEDVLAELSADSVDEDEERLRKHTGVLDKFQKSIKHSSRSQHEEEFEKMPVQPAVRDLELPEPEQEPTPEFQSHVDTLPTWLAKPIVISTDSRATFRDFGICSETAGRLSRLGFDEALPVQQALIPLLLPPGVAGSSVLPGTEAVLPDIAVSAPTGSGKTIAYLLPIIEAIRNHATFTKLRALVVVPTRELVLQVAAIAESLGKDSGLKIGMATGTGRFRDEQDKLIKRERRYDPEAYRQLMDEANSRNYSPDDDSLEFGAYMEEILRDDVKVEQHLQDAVHCLVEHVPVYESAVDILVATPGRLLEHLNHTLGFTLAHLNWLVVDEADKLLDNQYEDFLESLNMEITRPRSAEEQDGREQYLRSQGTWNENTERRLRKCVVSATMTRDISKLGSLRLRRPKLVIVRGLAEPNAQAGAPEKERLDFDDGVKENADGYELPRTLVEYCVPVGDGGEKPLVAMELLSSKILHETQSRSKLSDGPERDEAFADDSDSSSDSGESSILSSNDSSSSEDDSSSEPDRDISVEENNMEKPDDLRETDISTLDAALSRRIPSMTKERVIGTEIKSPTILIFTSSNESANRLSHLLKGLKPAWTPWMTNLIKSKPGQARVRSKSDEPAIVVSTDRAARGLDCFSDQKGAKRLITHVIQYDVPRSLTSYIHRVGRTARAGRHGDAWTLYTHSEARWFVNEITKAEKVTRAGGVERVKVFMEDEDLRVRFKEVLEGMREEVFEGGR